MLSFYAEIWQRGEANPINFLDSVEIGDTLNFGTQLHGGFANASFIVTGAVDRSYQRYRTYLGADVVVYDYKGSRIYEGEITKVGIVPSGISVEAAGHYIAAGLIYFDMIYFSIEATQNLIRNPSFENNVTDSWSLSAGSRAQYADAAYGSKCAQLTQPSSGSELKFYTNVVVSSDTEYTMSLWAKNIDVQGNVQVKIEQKDSGGSVIYTTAKTLNGLSTTSWVFFDQPFTTLSGAASVDVSVVCPTSSSQGSILVDAIMLEEKPYSTEYCDGSLGALYSWDGDAHNSTSQRQAFSYTVGDIIADCIDLMGSNGLWRGLKVFVTNADAVVGSQDFTDKKVKDAIEVALKFGYSEDSLRPAYFAIWDNKVPHLFPEPSFDQFPDWFVSKTMSSASESVSNSLDSVYNRVYAAYDNQNEGPSKTLPANDAISQFRYGIREGLVQNGSNPEGLAMAEALRDMALDRYKSPRQIYSLNVSGVVQHGSGHLDYPYKIRAGDTILITDADLLTALGGELVGQIKDGLLGFVVSTNYSASTNSVEIQLGTNDQSFEMAMGRLGLSGGLS